MDPDHPRQHGGPPRAHKVSYNRPIETRHYRAVNTVFNAEYPFVRFLEANGYDVSYTTGVSAIPTLINLAGRTGGFLAIRPGRIHRYRPPQA